MIRGQRQQSRSPVRRCLPCRPTNSCGYQQGEPSLYLVSCVLLVELDFCTTGYLTATSKDQTHGGIRLSCRSDTIPAREPLGHPTPYLQGHQSVQVPTNKCNQEESLLMVHLRWSDRDTSGMNRRGLSSYRPDGAETPAERTKEDYPRIIPVGLRYRVGDESEIRAQTLVSETRSDSAESRRCRFLWALALCRTCSSCIYSIVSVITPRVITTRYLILLANMAQVHCCIYNIYLSGCIGYRKGTTSGDNDRLCI